MNSCRALHRQDKEFAILNHIPITLSRLANPTLKVCAWLTNFQPPLVPPSPEFMATAVDSNPSPPNSTDVAGHPAYLAPKYPQAHLQKIVPWTQSITQMTKLCAYIWKNLTMMILISEHFQTLSMITEPILFMHCQHAS